MYQVGGEFWCGNALLEERIAVVGWGGLVIAGFVPVESREGFAIEGFEVFGVDA